jgi:succinate-semialdehyde dehydrogenase/glutarate-semialdehyde dehydrogenase
MILKWRTAGQACTHANRIYVQSGVHEQFEKMVLDAVSKISVGHGSQPGSTMGPLTTPRGIEKLEMLVEDARSKGGKVKTGGRRPPTLTKGNFYEPTVISEMTSDMLASREEIFGPLLCIYRFETENEAIECANDTLMV